MLALVTKTYSDFADLLVANTVLCDPRSGLVAGWPQLTGQRLRKAEQRLLRLLDFRTTVRPAEFFDDASLCGGSNSMCDHRHSLW